MLIRRVGRRALAELILVLSMSGRGLAQAAPAPRPPAPGDSAAVRAAETWLALVDSGRYGQSWERAAPLFREFFPLAQWEQAASGLRGRLGALQSRLLAAVRQTETLPGAPSGQYLVLMYESSFALWPRVAEDVTLVRGPDGWGVFGYTASGRPN